MYEPSRFYVFYGCQNCELETQSSEEVGHGPQGRRIGPNTSVL